MGMVYNKKKILIFIVILIILVLLVTCFYFFKSNKKSSVPVGLTSVERADILGQLATGTKAVPSLNNIQRTKILKELEIEIGKTKSSAETQ
jgi:uncharacterized protein YpmB